MTLTPDQIQRLHFEDGLCDESSAEGADDCARRRELQEALRPAEVPSVVRAVMAQVGGEGVPMREALLEGAGEPPQLWPAVALAIGAEPDALGVSLRDAIVAEADAAPAHKRMRAHWPLFVITGVAAAAAAVLMVVSMEEPERISEPVAAAIEPVVTPVARVAKAVAPAVNAELEVPGITIIESLESETASVLQVLQFDDDEPTIIFIDEEPGD